jgi:hypothetical protein
VGVGRGTVQLQMAPTFPESRNCPGAAHVLCVKLVEGSAARAGFKCALRTWRREHMSKDGGL